VRVRQIAAIRPKPDGVTFPSYHDAELTIILIWDAYHNEEAQVDWAHFGQVAVGRARRTLSCFVATLSWSRALYLEFFFDQTMENFLRGHVHAFED
jgi:hypothetical protein